MYSCSSTLSQILLRNSFGKVWILEVLGPLQPRGVAENELKLSLSKERKTIEIPLEK